MTPVLTPIYAALLTLVFLALSWRIIAYRRANRLSLGDSGDKSLLKRMRAQANFVEYVPLALLLMVLIELRGAPPVAVHALGLALLVGRILHALGFAATPQKLILRQIGTLLTLLVLALGALGLLGHALV